MVALGEKTTEFWDNVCRKAQKRNLGAASHRHVQEFVPWPTLCDDGRVMRISDPIASTAASVESLRLLKKKQYAEERRSSNGVHISRCPFKGESGPHIQRRRSTSSFSQQLFTIPNFLTPGDCERLITASEVNCFRSQHRDSVACTKWCRVMRNSYHGINYSIDLWTPGLKSVFADIRIEQEGGAFAVGAEPYVRTVRYENGGRSQPDTISRSTWLNKRFSVVSPNFYIFNGYRVLVYLNGSSRDVGGGETHAFYIHVNGDAKQSVAKIAPKTGMAVCIPCGEHNPMIEITPVTEGVLYMVELEVQFSNYTNEDIVRYKAEHPRKGKRKS